MGSNYVVESGKHVALGKAYVVESGKHIELSKIYVVENGKHVPLFDSGGGVEFPYDNALIYTNDSGYFYRTRSSSSVGTQTAFPMDTSSETWKTSFIPLNYTRNVFGDYSSSSAKYSKSFYKYNASSKSYTKITYNFLNDFKTYINSSIGDYGFYILGTKCSPDGNTLLCIVQSYTGDQYYYHLVLYEITDSSLIYRGIFNHQYFYNSSNAFCNSGSSMGIDNFEFGMNSVVLINMYYSSVAGRPLIIFKVNEDFSCSLISAYSTNYIYCFLTPDGKYFGISNDDYSVPTYYINSDTLSYTQIGSVVGSGYSLKGYCTKSGVAIFNYTTDGHFHQYKLSPSGVSKLNDASISTISGEWFHAISNDFLHLITDGDDVPLYLYNVSLDTTGALSGVSYNTCLVSSISSGNNASAWFVQKDVWDID